jgi:hypothetical protein
MMTLTRVPKRRNGSPARRNVETSEGLNGNVPGPPVAELDQPFRIKSILNRETPGGCVSRFVHGTIHSVGEPEWSMME